VAIANGVTNATGQTTTAESFGNLSLAYAGGPNTFARAGTAPTLLGPGGGTLNLAVAQGSNVTAMAGHDDPNGAEIGNAAFNIANDPNLNRNFVLAGGDPLTGLRGGNVAVNIGGTSSASQGNLVGAFGQGTLAINLGGTGNIIEAGDAFNALGKPPTPPAILSTAFGIGGSNNTVIALPGPFNIAGEINRNGTGQPPLINNFH
jgi:hypothetical protein